ncbi:hypothetical protein ACH4UM_23365 [Streptomyces sp. NPDC020801]
MLSHSSIVAREFSEPSVVDTKHATRRVNTGARAAPPGRGDRPSASAPPSPWTPSPRTRRRTRCWWRSRPARCGTPSSTLNVLLEGREPPVLRPRKTPAS